MQITRASSSEVRPVFEAWITAQHKAGVLLVILEGITHAGKTTLTKLPFKLGSSSYSINIDLDDFLSRPVPQSTLYVDAIDCPRLHRATHAAIGSSPLVVVQGAIAWPLVRSVAASLGKESVRRVYLKRMWSLRPDFWVDEDFILDRELWPPTDYHRSIYLYHAEQQPWLSADLIIERVEEAGPAVRP